MGVEHVHYELPMSQFAAAAARELRFVADEFVVARPRKDGV